MSLWQKDSPREKPQATDYSGRRVQISANCHPANIAPLALNLKLDTVQFMEPLPPRLLDVMNEELFSVRPDVTLRVYGFYGHNCDLGFCKRMTNVRRFRADCLQDVSNVEAICSMQRLLLLGIGIFHLETFAFLNDVSDTISELSLESTKSKKPDLTPLARFRNLSTLGLHGQQKHIEVLAGHPLIHSLTMTGVALKSVELLNTFTNLAELTVGLGGTRDFSALAGNKTIKSLELFWISKFTDLDFLSSLRQLQRLQLEKLKHIQKLPHLRDLQKLRRVELRDMKALTDVSTLNELPALEQLIHAIAATQPEDYRELLQKPSMKLAGVHFRTVVKDKMFSQMKQVAGIQDMLNAPFQLY